MHIEPSDSARDGLTKVQDALQAIEPSLLRCPSSALHVSVVWLLAVHVDYGEPKSVIWARHGHEWIAELGMIASEHQPFAIRYRWLVATNSAVIAVAEPVAPVRSIRTDIAARLSLPEQTNNRAELVHTTLCRFRSPLSQPERLPAKVDALNLDVPTSVEQLTVSEELVFPSLTTSTKARVAIG